MTAQQVYQSVQRHLATRNELQKQGYQFGLVGFKRISGTATPQRAGVIAIDCEMCTSWKNGEYCQEVIRISIVDHRNATLRDIFVRPRYMVVNYNTEIHGITQAQAQSGVSLSEVHSYLEMNFYSNTIIVGHSLEHDFKALELEHSWVVDVSLLKRRPTGQKYSLKELTQLYLRRTLPDHDSLEDARAAMNLALTL